MPEFIVDTPEKEEVKSENESYCPSSVEDKSKSDTKTVSLVSEEIDVKSETEPISTQ